MENQSEQKIKKFAIGASSLIGGRKENQDSYGYIETPLGLLVTVCDGMGGGPGGKTASLIAVREIMNSVRSEPANTTDREGVLKRAVSKANKAILEEGVRNPDLKGMGSTATVVLIDDNSATIAFVGDSRIYQIRDNKKIFRTFDHSMVFELVNKGVINEEQARLSAQSNVITRALGMKPEINVETHTLSFRKGDRFVLCSDGIHGTLPETDLIELLSSKAASPLELTTNVSSAIDSLCKSKGGGHDNLTIAVIEPLISSTGFRKKQSKKIILGICAASILVLGVIIAILFYKSEPKITPEEATQTEASVNANENDSITNSVSNKPISTTPEIKKQISPTTETNHSISIAPETNKQTPTTPETNK